MVRGALKLARVLVDVDLEVGSGSGVSVFLMPWVEEDFRMGESLGGHDSYEIGLMIDAYIASSPF